MIPGVNGFLETGIEIEQIPDRSYKMHLYSGCVIGFCTGLEAVKQAIYKILNTERYQYIMYSWNYGIELADLYGEPVSYVCLELERRITEALTWDDRIEDVTDFQFDFPEKGIVHVKFTAHTIYGDVEAEKEVKV